jgi:hypothetical protein
VTCDDGYVLHDGQRTLTGFDWFFNGVPYHVTGRAIGRMHDPVLPPPDACHSSSAHMSVSHGDPPPPPLDGPLLLLASHPPVTRGRDSAPTVSSYHRLTPLPTLTRSPPPPNKATTPHHRLTPLTWLPQLPLASLPLTPKSESSTPKSERQPDNTVTTYTYDFVTLLIYIHVFHLRFIEH